MRQPPERLGPHGTRHVCSDRRVFRSHRYCGPVSDFWVDVHPRNNQLLLAGTLSSQVRVLRAHCIGQFLMLPSSSRRCCSRVPLCLFILPTVCSGDQTPRSVPATDSAPPDPVLMRSDPQTTSSEARSTRISRKASLVWPLFGHLVRRSASCRTTKRICKPDVVFAVADEADPPTTVISRIEPISSPSSTRGGSQCASISLDRSVSSERTRTRPRRADKAAVQ